MEVLFPMQLNGIDSGDLFYEGSLKPIIKMLPEGN